ncbi:MAG: T9SS C-terminal target domain-containing protein [Candidatus Neomarinimicrobiota bacterium]|nr:MAG: T9SS C-terminal target domain-containing protein [Candidatus Neomarinimicrobiota bacterium]
MSKYSRLVFLSAMLSLLSAQLTITPYGYSPRQAEEDTTDIFTQPYNALVNVGIGTQMYFRGKLEGGSLISPVWSVTGPSGSTADFGDSWNMDSTTQIIAFVPDVAGTYTITMTSDTNVASITINAGTYVGVNSASVSVSCMQCHYNKYQEWINTGHASMLERGLNGTLSSHYSGYCIGCHTTGFNYGADNNGFDDRTQTVDYYGGVTPFVFPDSAAIVDLYGGPLEGTLFDGLYDQVVQTFPNSMELANIQCEACHGPGSEHFGNTADHRIDVSLDVNTCAICHDEGSHHAFPDQWRYSVHGNPTTLSYAGTRASCAQCHSGSGFIAYLANGMNPLETAPDPVPIGCASCHDPHSVENIHQLRTVGPTILGNGVVITQGGTGQLCMTCHKSRRNSEEYTGPDFHYSSHFGPHHGPQADMLAGTNALTFGRDLPSSPHLEATEDACVTCHMSGSLTDADGNINHVGGHTFSMTDPDGNDHVEACAPCHGELTSFHEKKFYDANGVADHDGDGIEEGVQDEVAGLLEELALMLPPVDDPTVDVSGTYEYTLTEIKAAYNYFFVMEDRSGGIHNPAFAVSLLKTSIQALLNHAIEGEIVAIDDVPNDQGYMVRIVWDKLADDGVAVDPIQTYAIQRFDDYGSESTWTTVGEVTATGAYRYALDVPTLFNVVGTDTNWTEFKVVAISQSGATHESLPGAGYSVDNLIPAAPSNVLASVEQSAITLSWEAPADPDVNYYTVLRSTTGDFTDAVTVAMTADLTIMDTDLSPGSYYYKIAATDFSENQGEWSSVVNATVLGTDEEPLPLDFSLFQNYPNPFNPTTTIEFTLPEDSPVHLAIYNTAGQLVKTLVDTHLQAGRHTLSVNGSDLASGMYIYIMEAGSFVESKKMILMK